MPTINRNDLEQPWAITQEALDYLQHIHVRQDKEPEAADHKVSMPGESVQVENGVAVISIRGSLFKRQSRYWESYEGVRAKVQAALDDWRCRAILLDIDSPGGLVSGCLELAEWLIKAGQQKAIYSFTDGAMCSGAYWLGCTAKQIACTPTSRIGSIGVITAHTDWSGWDEQAGLKTTYLTAGEYKGAPLGNAPINERDRAYVLEQLHQIYELFINAVATGRGVNTEAALKMADGKVFNGNPAKDLGLVDHVVSGRDEFLQLIKEEVMDKDQLLAQHPEVHAAIEAEARTGYVSAAEAQEAQDTAKAEEAARVIGLLRAISGDEAAETLKALADTGTTPEAAQAVAKAMGKGTATGEATTQPPDAEAEAKAKILNGIEKATEKPLDTASGQPGAEPEAKDYLEMVRAYAEEHNCSRAKAMAAIDKQHPGLRGKFVNSEG